MKRGFTLVEMLIVLAVVAVLAGVGYPLGRSMVDKGREAACVNQLRTLGAALQGYLQDHGERMPEMTSMRASKTEEAAVLEIVLLPYAGSPGAFRCPADHEQFEKTGSSYLWNSTQNGLHVSQLAFFGIKDRPDRIPLIIDKEAWHPHGSNFLYADFSSSNRPRFVAGN